MNMIKALCIPLTILALASSPALADGKGNGNKKHKKHHTTQSCPPGLAKKSPACIPPGQAKKMGHDHDDGDHVIYYRVGDVVRDDCRIVPYTGYKSLPDGTYCRYEDRLLRIDPESRAVLTILQVLANN
ncbi:hypothetical protein GCM10010873_26200 [Cypionkella aquatica]|uniref:Excinuclease ABC subunit A n=1 Tax=Cypionkella aquatica TaxID=1756042 RepID=A0AA37U396_9RHOB|nr:hypothetical protein [Cypionkella aquatica]GLS87646.1 hypothetical protein GCM10010873_26200 [Cypionkella aquatica]